MALRDCLVESVAADRAQIAVIRTMCVRTICYGVAYKTRAHGSLNPQREFDTSSFANADEVRTSRDSCRKGPQSVLARSAPA
jgi:hypothetical protein